MMLQYELALAAFVGLALAFFMSYDDRTGFHFGRYMAAAIVTVPVALVALAVFSLLLSFLKAV